MLHPSPFHALPACYHPFTRRRPPLATAALPDSRRAAAATDVGREVFELVEQIDYNKYFESSEWRLLCALASPADWEHTPPVVCQLAVAACERAPKKPCPRAAAMHQAAVWNAHVG